MRFSVTMQWKFSCGLALALCIGLQATPVMADDDDDGPKSPDMHQLAAHPPVPRAHKDFSAYHYRPVGDRVVEQPAANRLMFWTKDGKPDGYAERRGDAVVYYDAAGHPTRVQHLTPDEIN